MSKCVDIFLGHPVFYNRFVEDISIVFDCRKIPAQEILTKMNNLHNNTELKVTQKTNKFLRSPNRKEKANVEIHKTHFHRHLFQITLWHMNLQLRKLL